MTTTTTTTTAPTTTTTAQSAPLLMVDAISKDYGHTPVLNDLTLTIPHGQFLSILGPSGCGKSTLLSILAGLSQPSSGTVSLGGRPIDGPGLDRGVVFQHHALLPWLTAQGNIEFALKHSHPHLTASQRRQRALEALDTVHLGHAAHRRPAQLSGGMQQRVGIARALAIEPKILLLDEPFGALDALTRADLQEQLASLWASRNMCVVLVTHDVDEALLLSSRIVVLGQLGTIKADVDISDEHRDQQAPQLRKELLTHLRAS